MSEKKKDQMRRKSEIVDNSTCICSSRDLSITREDNDDNVIEFLKRFYKG